MLHADYVYYKDHGNKVEGLRFDQLLQRAVCWIQDDASALKLSAANGHRLLAARLVRKLASAHLQPCFEAWAPARDRCAMGPCLEL